MTNKRAEEAARDAYNKWIGGGETWPASTNLTALLLDVANRAFAAGQSSPTALLQALDQRQELNEKRDPYPSGAPVAQEIPAWRKVFDETLQVMAAPASGQVSADTIAAIFDQHTTSYTSRTDQGWDWSCSCGEKGYAADHEFCQRLTKGHWANMIGEALLHSTPPIDTLPFIRNAIIEAKQTGDAAGALRVIEEAIKPKGES